MKTEIKTNLQLQIENLFQKYPLLANKNTIFNGEVFEPIFPAFMAEYQKCKLSEEELAVANVTIERIEIGFILLEALNFARKAISLTQKRGESEIPDWVKEKGSDDEALTLFVQNIEKLEGQTLSFFETVSHQTVQSVKDAYAQWKTLQTQETLDATAKEKVRNLIDIRRVLIAITASKGYSEEAVRTKIMIES